MMELVLIRGLPGSGKSTMARAMKTHRHFEADMFFTDLDGAYLYDASKIKAAHEWCQMNAKWALERGESVVVSNTFTRQFEMAPYFAMAKTFGIEPRIVEATGNWPNVHGVPAEVVEKKNYGRSVTT
jgi:predicted kinase